jgi:tRNA U38,U39,U40 pseudouridine synthase TruA
VRKSVQAVLLLLSCKQTKQDAASIYDMEKKKRRHMAAHMVLHLLLLDASHLIDLLIRPGGCG